VDDPKCSGGSHTCLILRVEDAGDEPPFLRLACQHCNREWTGDLTRIEGA
jgi:hypothetical protein